MSDMASTVIQCDMNRRRCERENPDQLCGMIRRKAIPSIRQICICSPVDTAIICMASEQNGEVIDQSTYRPPLLQRRQVVIALSGAMLALFLGSLDQTVVGTAMPKIVSDLGGFTRYTWITTSYIVAATIAVPITGKLSDMYGRKLFYIIGLALFTLGSLFCGLSQDMMQIIAFRGLQGIGAGIIMANAFIVIGDLFPPSERGKYQGLTAGVFGVAAAVGPTLGGFITDSLSWEWVFLINVPLGIPLIILFMFYLPGMERGYSKHRVDYPGVVALILTVMPAMLALSWAGVDYPWISPLIIGMFLFSAAMAVVFILIERRSDEPILPLWIFTNRIVLVSISIIALTGAVMYGGIVFIPLFFQGVLGVSATATGGLVTPLLLAVVGGSLISGQVLSRAGGHYRRQGLVGLAIMALGIGLLSTLNAESHNSEAVIYITLTGLGLGITYPLYTIAVQNAVPYAVMGVATSSATFFRNIGGALGLAILGSVMNNRFATEFLNRISPEAEAVISPEPLHSLIHNPQALLNTESQAQLKDIYDQSGPAGAGLYEQMFQSLRQALDSTVMEVFLTGLVVVLIAWAVNLFLVEIPLRKHHV